MAKENLTSENYIQETNNSMLEVSRTVDNLQDIAITITDFIDQILDLYNENWKYLSDDLSIVNPYAEEWIDEVPEEDRSDYYDAYEDLLGWLKEATNTGKSIEKAVNKLRDAKGIIEREQWLW